MLKISLLCGGPLNLRRSRKTWLGNFGKWVGLSRAETFGWLNCVVQQYELVLEMAAKCCWCVEYGCGRGVDEWWVGNGFEVIGGC